MKDIIFGAKIMKWSFWWDADLNKALADFTFKPRPPFIIKQIEDINEKTIESKIA